MIHKVAIIGGGPAGIAAAIQLRRYKIPVILFEQSELGGLIKNANRVENYPGFPDGVSGEKLARILREQLLASDTKIIVERVLIVDYNSRKRIFSISTQKGTYSAGILILASGTKPREIDRTVLLDKDINNKIYYEIFPIRKSEGKKILIVGGGDIAFDYALSLAVGNEVIILNRSVKPKANPVLLDEIFQNPNISYHSQSNLFSIQSNKTNKLSVSFLDKKKVCSMEIDYIVAAIGRESQKDFYSPALAAEEKRLIDEGVLYLAGDVKNGIFRQVAIASGDGIKTAMKIYQIEGESE